MSDDNNFLQEINELKIAPSLLGEVMILWASLPVETTDDFDQKLNHTLDYVVTKDGSPMLAMAVALRLVALDSIVMTRDFRAWLLPERSPDGITFIHGDLLKVAAEQILLEGPAGEPAFDQETFRWRLMELISAHGRA